MTTIQDVLAARNDEARKAIAECLNGIPAAYEYRPAVEQEDSALYVLLRAVYFAGRDKGIANATAAWGTPNACHADYLGG